MQAGCITINKSFSVAAAHVRIEHLKQYLMVIEMIFQPFVAVVIMAYDIKRGCETEACSLMSFNVGMERETAGTRAERGSSTLLGADAELGAHGEARLKHEASLQSEARRKGNTTAGRGRA